MLDSVLYFRNRSLLLSVLFCCTFISTLRASVCFTVSSGDFYSPSTWNCNCTPYNCDSIIVNHSLYFSEPFNIDAHYLIINESGALNSYGDIQIENSLHVLGYLTAPHINLMNSSEQFLCTGQVLCSNMTLSCDSASITGSLVVQNELLLNHCFIDNRGSLSTGTARTWTFATLFNAGTITADSLLYMTTLYVFPEGELTTDYLLSTALVLNEGSMAMDKGQLLNLDNFGQLHCNGLLQLGTGSFLGNVILRPNSMTSVTELLNFGSASFQTNSLTMLAKLDNRGGLNGHGTICISDSSINQGTVLGSLRICDATSIDGAGGFDINTGTIAPTVTYCANSSCSWTSMSDEASVPTIQINPNPAVDLLHIQLGSSSPEVDRIEVRDLGGRLVHELTGAFAERIVLHRDGLVAGTYLLRVLRTSGGTMATQLVVFTD